MYVYTDTSGKTCFHHQFLIMIIMIKVFVNLPEVSHINVSQGQCWDANTPPHTHRHTHIYTDTLKRKKKVFKPKQVLWKMSQRGQPKKASLVSKITAAAAPQDHHWACNAQCGNTSSREYREQGLDFPYVFKETETFHSRLQTCSAEQTTIGSCSSDLQEFGAQWCWDGCYFSLPKTKVLEFEIKSHKDFIWDYTTCIKAEPFQQIETG